MPAPLKEQAVKYLVVHCSATPPRMRVDRTMIDRWHRERGFLGIGYHFVITREGVVQEGRPLDAIGAHVEGHNHESIGICLAGGVDTQLPPQPQNNFTGEQMVSLAELLKTLLKTYTRAQIVGHTQLNPNKACPSFDVPKWWHETVAAPEVDA